MDVVYSKGERIADGAVHAIGIFAGLVAVTAMMLAATQSLPVPATVSLAVYGLFLLCMLCCSAAYHLFWKAPWRDTLRRMDHAAIFLKIAGTYTPLAFIKMANVFAYALLGLIWAVAILGAAGKLLLVSRWDKTAIALYLALGWAGLIMWRPLSTSAPPAALALLALGGGLYTVGVIFHLWRNLPYQNAIWHLFVLAGTSCHFGAVTTAIWL